MWHVTEHDPSLVVVAALLCTLASWTSLTLLSRARINDAQFRWRWILAAAGVFGAGVWATHFVSMLALRSEVPLGYDFGLTVLSIAIAIGFAYAGFSLVFRPGWSLLGGAIIGFGISAMHYVGIFAVEAPVDIRWDGMGIALSVCVGVGFGMLAALAGTGIRNIRGRVVATACFVVGICAMHFTAMDASTFVPDPAASYDDAAVLAPGMLAIAISAVALLVIVLGLAVGLLDRHLELRRSGENARMRSYIAQLEATRCELRSALRDARAASDAKSAFLAAMSHELRTPLNAIIGFSDFILSKPSGETLQPRQHEYVEEIHKSGMRLLMLINDILDLTSLDAGKLPLRESTVSLEHLLGEVCAAMEPEAEAAGVHLTASSAQLYVLADEHRLKQIVFKLISNAIKFTPRGGAVDVRAEASGHGCAIEVRDTGIGIAAEDIARTLERFGQVDSRLARRYEGAGLGLPLARQLAELHGGTLAIESRLGAGTTVTVTLPAGRIVSLQSPVAA
jgi:signal transduction histidine kinase